MGKHYSSAVIPSLPGAAQVTSGDKIWCVHYECYKYIQVCNRCRVRIKCMNFQDYWKPRFDFQAT